VTGRLGGKAAVVVGGGQSPGVTIGNGRATAMLFAREGAAVLVVDRDGAAAADTVAAIVHDSGATVHACTADVTSADDCARIAATALDLFGRVDVLHNNVGIVGEMRDSVALSEAGWHQALDVNLKGTWLTCKYVLPGMRERGTGAIVNISSMAAIMPGAGTTPYGLSKIGVNMLTQGLALENAAYGIRVNAVLPGLIDTPLGVDDKARDRGVDRSVVAAERDAQVPLRGRMGTAWDVARASLFLASDEASFVTGVLLTVDGGQTLRCG
jgi:NAD(P)-dependent dehydrogenase (short-subunit alcohol dehydrogenase family)